MTMGLHLSNYSGLSKCYTRSAFHNKVTISNFTIIIVTHLHHWKYFWELALVCLFSSPTSNKNAWLIIISNSKLRIQLSVFKGCPPSLFFFWLHHVAHGILVPPPGSEPGTLALSVESQPLDNWAIPSKDVLLSVTLGVHRCIFL